MIKIEVGKPILQLPKQEKITKRMNVYVDRDRACGWDIAGPLFSAGCSAIGLAQLPAYTGGKYAPARHRINLVIQGTMEFRYGSKTLIARRGDLVFTPAGIKQQRVGQGPIVWLYIALEDIPMWTPLKNMGPYLRKYESADLMYMLTCRMIGALRTQDVYSMQCARESATTLVTVIKRELLQANNAWPSKRMNSIVEILDRIRARPEEEWNRSKISQALHMSDRSLSRDFKRIFNMPLTKMVTSIRIDIASSLLINTDRTLLDIASSVGYENPFSFSRVFKKCVGVSPKRYRSMPAAERQRLALAAHE